MIFYKIRKIDKNRFFIHIKDSLDLKKMISMIFYIFWIIQIDFLKKNLKNVKIPIKIIQNPSFPCYLIPKNSKKSKTKTSMF